MEKEKKKGLFMINQLSGRKIEIDLKKKQHPCKLFKAYLHIKGATHRDTQFVYDK